MLKNLGMEIRAFLTYAIDMRLLLSLQTKYQQGVMASSLTIEQDCLTGLLYRHVHCVPPFLPQNAMVVVF